MRRISSIILSIVIILPLLSINTWAASNSVNITIPSFKVTINDKAVNSTKLQYPLIVYKDITYFPLTWNWCRELGLVSGYSEADGLYIANDYPESQETLDRGGHQTAGSKFTAAIPGYPIYINGRQIDNSKEEFPLLNFRGITYFPLTWRFVTEEFGWDQTWDGKSGYRLSTDGSAGIASPGTHYFDESLYLLESYRDYAILENMKEERSIGTVADQYGNYSDNFVNRILTNYKLDYTTDKLTQVASEKTSDTPYLSGATTGVDASELFSGTGAVLFYGGSTLLDLSKDAGEGNSIDHIISTKHVVNGLTVYRTAVYFTQGQTSVPAPYTPCKYYAWVDSGDGTLHRIKSWPTDQILTAVYPYGTTGFYLCSDARISVSARYNNRRSWICQVGSDLSETTLNGRWKDWNSLTALGMDAAGNLYLLNTQFSDSDIFNRGAGTVNPVCDGYYRLGTDGTLSKIYPFVRANDIFVTPTGAVYISEVRMNHFLHLQTGTEISIKQ